MTYSQALIYNRGQNGPEQPGSAGEHSDNINRNTHHNTYTVLPVQTSKYVTIHVHVFVCTIHM